MYEKTVILIPARFSSSRFPGKPLAMIAGISMIQRVYQNCELSGIECAVVTDDDRIEQHVKGFGGKVVRVDDDVPSGSERIALAFQRYYKERDIEIIINVQGDEPLLKGDILQELAQFHASSNFDIATLIRPRLSTDKEFSNPNVVKAVYSEGTKECLYFSRASLPYSRDSLTSYKWYQHIGVYSYKAKALEAFVKLPESSLEVMERLEQLRALENNMRIGAIVSNQKLVGVDVPEDVEKVEEVLSES
ncbi:MAG: 3-deoxy-manno-octulosonate cytidylyltransferase [Bacteriovoracaceae bacterium]